MRLPLTIRTSVTFISTAFVLCLCLSFQSDEISWVAIGDSITYLNDHRDETGNRITKGYMTRVGERHPEIKYINQGHNGWTAGDIAGEIENLGLVKADFYSVFLGTNDWWRGRPLGLLADYTKNTGNSTVFGSFRIIIDKIRSLNPNARIILVTPMQRVDFVYLNDMKNNAYGSYKDKNGQSLEEFANAVLKIGKQERLAVVDLFHKKGMGLKNMVKYKRLKDPSTGYYREYAYPDFIDVPFNPAADEYPYPVSAADITYDGLHPSDKGYQIIADMVEKAFAIQRRKKR